jgi:hypothetical protein
MIDPLRKWESPRAVQLAEAQLQRYLAKLAADEPRPGAASVEVKSGLERR